MEAMILALAMVTSSGGGAKSVLDPAGMQYREAVKRADVGDATAPEAFRATAALYAEGISAGFNDHANLAACLFLAGDLPEALRAVRVGLEAHPEDARLLRLLADCRAEVRVPPGSTLRATDGPPSGHHLVRAALTSGVLIGVLALLRFRLSLAHVLLATILAFGAGLAGQVYVTPHWPAAEVVARETSLRLGNGDAFPAHAAEPLLPAGLEVRIVETRGDWRRVECPNGVRGWIPAAALVGR